MKKLDMTLQVPPSSAKKVTVLTSEVRLDSIPFLLFFDLSNNLLLDYLYRDLRKKLLPLN